MIGDTIDSLHHSDIIECITATSVQGVQDDQVVEQAEDLLSVALGAVDGVVDQVQLHQVVQE